MFPASFCQRAFTISSLKYEVLIAQSCPILCRPMDCSLPGSTWNSSGKNTGVGSHALLQGIFLTEGSKLGILYSRQFLYHLSHQEARVNISQLTLIKEQTLESKYPSLLTAAGPLWDICHTISHRVPKGLSPLCLQWSYQSSLRCLPSFPCLIQLLPHMFFGTSSPTNHNPNPFLSISFWRVTQTKKKAHDFQKGDMDIGQQTPNVTLSRNPEHVQVREPRCSLLDGGISGKETGVNEELSICSKTANVSTVAST